MLFVLGLTIVRDNKIKRRCVDTRRNVRPKMFDKGPACNRLYVAKHASSTRLRNGGRNVKTAAASQINVHNKIVSSKSSPRKRYRGKPEKGR